MSSARTTAFDDTFIGYTSPARAEVLAALAEDGACRVPGVTAGLYGLGELAPFARLGHGIPVVRHTTSWLRYQPVRFDRAADDAEFSRRLYRAAPFLRGFDLKAHGLCLAGGAASALLMRSDTDRIGTTFHDYDFFLVGHPDEVSAKEAIRALQRHLYERCGGEGRVEAYRTKGCLTFHIREPLATTPQTCLEEPGLEGSPSGGKGLLVQVEAYRTKGSLTFHIREPLATTLPQTCLEEPGLEGSPSDGKGLLVQVIFRQYSTAAEVIHGFDLGSSAVLWDGERVRTTALGKIAFEHGANVLNLAARRNSYERRLARYFERGFDLVMPDLSGLKLLQAGGRLPYLYVQNLSCRGGCACDLWSFALCATRPEYDSYGRRPGHPNWDAPLAETSDYEAGRDTYGNVPALTARNVRALGGEQVRVESLCAHATLTPDLDLFEIQPALDEGHLADRILSTFKQGTVHVKTLTEYLGQTAAVALLVEYTMARGKMPSRDAVLELAAVRCAALRANAVIPFAFMTVEDKTALTGPFPRSLVPLAQWYGEAQNDL